jgi:hypothetical protein
MNDTLHDVARWADRGDRIAIAMVVGAVRSEREHLKVSPTGILKRFAYDHRSDSMSLDHILDLRVHERHQSWRRQ